ncbi:MAG: Uma2 family endonuclease [Bacteroidota bacterium]
MTSYSLQLNEAQEKILLPLLEALGIPFWIKKDLPAPLPRKDTYELEEIQAFADQFPKEFRWTVNDLSYYFPDDLKISVQLLHNQLLIIPAPTPEHQRISEEIGFQLGTFLRKYKLGRVLYAPIDVVFDENNLKQPDIIVVTVARYPTIEAKRVTEAPDLVVEIWSEGSLPKEKEIKYDLYEQHGVLEYWQIFPDQKYVSVEALGEKGFELFSEGREKGVVKSKLLEGFTVEVKELFGA